MENYGNGNLINTKIYQFFDSSETENVQVLF